MEQFKYKLMKGRAKDLYKFSAPAFRSGDIEGINIGYRNFLKVIIDSKTPKDLTAKGIIFKDLPSCKGIITKAYEQHIKFKVRGY